MIEFTMPSLGADMEDGILVGWRMKKGDTIKRGDIIADVETQKGLIEIEVFEDGVIDALLIKEGTTVPVGTPMALISTTTEGQVKQVTEKPEIITSSETPEIITEPKKIRASPLAKRIASDHKIDLSQLYGTGENGAITREDVENAIAQRVVKPEGLPVKRDEVSDMSISNAIRTAVAAAMEKSNKEIPHYYLEKTIDMTKILAWINETNKARPIKLRLLPAAFLIKAVALSLQEVPELNATWENGLQIKSDINIGFVVSLRGGGIIVPAIHAAYHKSVDEIMFRLNDIIPRAKALKLRSSELSDSTITITSIGEGGADRVYGIIYPPQVAIVGFGNISEQPFAENGMLGIRALAHVTLAADHRATDGLTGSRFLTVLNAHLQNPETL